MLEDFEPYLIIHRARIFRNPLKILHQRSDKKTLSVIAQTPGRVEL